MTTAGFHAVRNRARARASGVSSRTKSRSGGCAFAWAPPSGPGRPAAATSSSVLRTGAAAMMSRSLICAGQSRARSLRSAWKASFPPVSPPRRPPSRRTRSLPLRAASSAVATGGSAKRMSGIARPSPVTPRRACRTFGEDCASARANSSTGMSAVAAARPLGSAVRRGAAGGSARIPGAAPARMANKMQCRTMGAMRRGLVPRYLVVRSGCLRGRAGGRGRPHRSIVAPKGAAAQARRAPAIEAAAPEGYHRARAKGAGAAPRRRRAR